VGSDTLTAYANDSVGNLNTSSVTFTVKTSAPNLTIISPTNITYNTRQILVNLSTSADATSVWFNWNGTNVTYTVPVLVNFSVGSDTLTAYGKRFSWKPEYLFSNLHCQNIGS